MDGDGLGGAGGGIDAPDATGPAAGAELIGAGYEVYADAENGEGEAATAGLGGDSGGAAAEEVGTAEDATGS